VRKMTKKRKITAVALIGLALCSVFLVFAPGTSGNATVLEPVRGSLDVEFESAVQDALKVRYEDYIAQYEGQPHPDVSLVIEAESYVAADGMEIETIQQFEGASNPVIRTGDSGSVHWDIEVPEDGLYHISLRYFPVEGHSSTIERELLIDGIAPFDEATRLGFSRVWRNEFPEVKRDSRDNDLRPRQVEEPQWQETTLRDSEGYYNEPFSFYFTKGKHRMTLSSLREPMVIDYIKLYQEEEIPTYDEVKAFYQQQGYQPTSGEFVKVQGEDATLKSNPSLYPINDRSSPGTEPYHVSKIRMNAIGGVNWKVPGQWITWEVDVPKDGLYELGFRYKQDTNRGIKVVRKLYIDGKVPFSEVEAVPFNYSGSWQIGLPGEDNEPYLYYLTEGKHEIKLELTMGELTEVIRLVRSSIQELNNLYLKIVMLTSAAPDPYRDYQLEQKIPELESVFLEQSQLLSLAADRMDDMVGGASSSTTILRTTSYQLGDLGSRPETLTRRLKNFKDNVSALGTWLLTVNDQPLTIDYLFIKSPDVANPPVDKGIVGKLSHEIGSFFKSFSEEYNYTETNDSKEAITVWMASGRDQVQLLRSLIDNSFTPQTGIEVNLQLVNPSVVLPATLAGQGPDIALTQSKVVDFAMRNALYDVSQFPDFEEVKARFFDSAFVSFTYQDGIYAIPETQTFPMLFYREDILHQLGLEVPKTWEDMYHIIPELKKNNMDLAMPNTIVFETMLYQNGGQYYKGDGIATDLDSPQAIETFRKWTELYTNYKLPLEFDFINRFRTGEMPLGIADYTQYNYLQVFAPEIRGQWNFAPLPGIVTEDGTTRHDTLSTTTGTVMFADAKNKDAAWEFIKWWTDTEAQVNFGREMEAILGESARYAAANIEALQQLPWSGREKNQLLEQFKHVQGRPEVPGGYSLDRHIVNAFYEVYRDGEEARETLENYVRTINQEITIKREEFDLPVLPTN